MSRKQEIFLLAATTHEIWSGILFPVALRCLLVDDSPRFLEAASNLLEGQGVTVVGTAATPTEALGRVPELEPDVTLVDVNLNGESGFDLAWELAAHSDTTPTNVILTSTRSESDYAELVAVTPALGFVSKNQLSAAVIRDFVADHYHGSGCRHEALVYSSAEELAAGAVPFLERGLARGEDVLVVLRAAGRAVLEQELGAEAGKIEFADALPWYQSPDHAYSAYVRYLSDRLERSSRVRVVAEVVWPQGLAPADVAGWKRYEAGISAAMASVPVSFICTYDTAELPGEIIMDAKRTHPVLRTADGARPSAQYVQPAAFVRSLERAASEPSPI